MPSPAPFSRRDTPEAHGGATANAHRLSRYYHFDRRVLYFKYAPFTMHTTHAQIDLPRLGGFASQHIARYHCRAQYFGYAFSTQLLPVALDHVG